MAKILLHGMLHVEIYGVDRMLGSSIWSVITDEGKKAAEEAWDWITGKKDLYASIDIDQFTVGKTRVLMHSDCNAKWDETFHIYCAHVASELVFSVKNLRPIVPDVVLGIAHLPVQELVGGQEVDTLLDLLDKNHGKPIQQGLKIHVKVQFSDVTKELNWNKGVKSPDFPGVPFTYFTQKSGCKVTLYQDAHVAESFSPRIPLSGGKYYEPHRCWEDIFDAISSAKHLIYITGWSVYTEITLIRDPERPKPGGDMTLGELLKKKAEEGVRVLMLVWDDRTQFSHTHDKETESYFRGSKVHCVLCPRNPDIDNKSILHDTEIWLTFTHHQKSLVVDSVVPSEGSNKRTIVSFLGGIDLCDGRYDTQSHSLFRTLNTVHHNDFYQSNFEGASLAKGGPREPWHDIHSRLEGPAARDVLSNFEQRWRKQGGDDNLLLDTKQKGDILIPDTSITLLDQDHETWNVQVFRSIDGGATFGFPESPKEAAKQGLVTRESYVIERSIQDGYINAIRRAKRFIYIENQYFLGSSFGWKGDTDVGALHLIPKELSLKIVSKIEEGERFSVYIVVPMWPEGIPDKWEGSVQAMLYWQRRTMEMMYTDISQALRAKGIDANPKDYLSFFCLGNREIKKIGEYQPTQEPKPDSDYSKAQKARRFMIYVHAKLMIVDDEYVIVGSANINQRSMDGGRDSEIAMGAYQPYHLSSQNQEAKGQVHGFRMSLWYEHLRLLDDVFLHPESLECVKKVNEIAQNYWELYTSKTFEHDLPGQLLPYPVKVTKNGEIEQLPDFEDFPDTKGKILGTKSLIPAIITT